MPENEIRDQLADLLRDATGGYTQTPPFFRSVAGEVLAAGWRPPARVIETVEELDALPDETVIRTLHGGVAQKSDDVWEFPNEIGQYLGDAIDLPITLLWTPEEVSA